MYITNTANNLEALRSALFDACVSAGWTLSGDIIWRGNVFVRIIVNGIYLECWPGTGKDGSNNIVGMPAYPVRMGRLVANTATDFNFPLTYHIHIPGDGDEVYMVVNYNVDQYQYIAFGQSTVQSVPGTGAWCSASATALWQSAYISLTNLGGTSYNTCPGLFFANDAFTGGNGAESTGRYPGQSLIHHGLDARGWSGGYYQNNLAIGLGPVAALHSVLPNAWNSESNLLPIQVWIPRTSGNKLSLVADIQHARYMRIDNHTPGEIITLGEDRWKVYPWWKKVTTSRNGNNGSSTGAEGTGTMGWAIRYDGL